jgi:hypothetical protein
MTNDESLAELYTDLTLERLKENPDLKSEFIPCWTEGYGFPHAAEHAFTKSSHKHRTESLMANPQMGL